MIGKDAVFQYEWSEIAIYQYVNAEYKGKTFINKSEGVTLSSWTASCVVIEGFLFIKERMACVWQLFETFVIRDGTLNVLRSNEWRIGRHDWKKK